MRFLIISFILLASLETVQSQNVIIKKIELAGEKIIVTYDLEDSNPVNEYKLDLYASKDNYATPLTKVSGAVGLEVKPGINKKIEWTVREEMGNYKGRVALEIRGKVYIPFVKLLNFNPEASYKKGKSYNLSLKAGNSNPIHVELYKGSQRISGEMNHPNNGAYTLTIPGASKPGKDYRIKITDSKSSEDLIYSPFFQVKPKVPFLVKVAVPVLVIGGALAALSGGGSGNSDIPLPPKPTN
jgi:hypothetical protein